MARIRVSAWSWIADVLCGAIGGFAVFGKWGALWGALFMAGAGQAYRRQRVRREAQLSDLRAKSALRQRRARHADAPRAEGA